MRYISMTKIDSWVAIASVVCWNWTETLIYFQILVSYWSAYSILHMRYWTWGFQVHSWYIASWLLLFLFLCAPKLPPPTASRQHILSTAKDAFRLDFSLVSLLHLSCSCSTLRLRQQFDLLKEDCNELVALITLPGRPFWRLFRTRRRRANRAYRANLCFSNTSSWSAAPRGL